MIVYKLTDKDGYCRRNRTGETLYKIGKTYTSDGNGELCTDHWRHAYEHPLLAIFHDPVHGDYGKTARLWECCTLDGVIKRDGMMKLGTTKLKVLREIPKPQVNTEQRIAYAISCSLRVYSEESYVIWTENWLSGKDRSRDSAAAAYMAAYMAADAAAYAAVCATTACTISSTRVSMSSSVPATARCAADAAAWEVACAAACATNATYAAATAAMKSVDEPLDLLSCVREVYLID